MVEGQLWSHDLEVAGTVDLVAEFDGEMAIIDWKTSNWPKKRNQIHSYFMQESAYAVMFEERTGIPVTRLVTLVANKDGYQMFVEERDDWIDGFRDLRNQYELEQKVPSMP
jgi:genome maintenance exonuclease 1